MCFGLCPFNIKMFHDYQMIDYMFILIYLRYLQNIKALLCECYWFCILCDFDRLVTFVIHLSNMCSSVCVSVQHWQRRFSLGKVAHLPGSIISRWDPSETGIGFSTISITSLLQTGITDAYAIHMQMIIQKWWLSSLTPTQPTHQPSTSTS